ncbi:MAG TPA: LysM domain-containing protein [Verrucomicrobiota bacterium]|nr:LysM domain-containing protein [Verrucomicrobiota bacterium]HNT13519.1 LysM domain-containing protein [Verrucomicrobiota bacterium]
MKKSRANRFVFCCRSWGTVATAVFWSVTAELCPAQTQNRPAPDKDVLGHPNDPAKAREVGQTATRRELSNGVMQVTSAGMPVPGFGEYAQLWKERCNVELTSGGCLVREGFSAYRRGYHEVPKTAIQQKLGTNVFDPLNKEAEARWEKKRAMAVPPAGKGAHLVNSGDTLTKIARVHGVTLNDVMRANPRVNPTGLQVKQQIIIPRKKQP